MSETRDHVTTTDGYSHSVYTSRRTCAVAAAHEAQEFLIRLSEGNRACSTTGFRSFRALVDFVAPEIQKHFFQPARYNDMCNVLRSLLCAFHEAVAEALKSVKEPFYYYDEALARRQDLLVTYFRALDGKECCGFRLHIDVPPVGITRPALLGDVRSIEDTAPALLERNTRRTVVENVLADVPQRQNNVPGAICTMCGLRIPSGWLLEEKISPQCDHDAVSCQGCLRESIAAQLESGVENLLCPRCPMVIESATVEKYASRESIEKYTVKSWQSNTRLTP